MIAIAITFAVFSVLLAAIIDFLPSWQGASGCKKYLILLVKLNIFSPPSVRPLAFVFYKKPFLQLQENITDFVHEVSG